MALKLPPPPKSRGVWGLLVTLVLVGWTGYLLATYDKKSEPAKAVGVAGPKGPDFVEIGLRGPQYDAGRYEGYQRGKDAKLKNRTLPTEQVLSFSAAQTAESKTLDAAQTEDFVAGYKSGYKQGITTD